METCACCFRPVTKVVVHHWFQPPTYAIRAACICELCNNFLTAIRLWPKDTLITRDWNTAVCTELNHVLPMFFLQQLIVWRGGYDEMYDRSLRRTYKLPLIPAPHQRRDYAWYKARPSIVPLRNTDDIPQIFARLKRELEELK